MQKGQNAQANDHRHGVADVGRINSEPVEDRLEQRRKEGFSESAQRKTGHRNAQVRGTEVTIEIRQNMAGHASPAMAFLDEMVELGVADFDDGELGRDKKAVEQHK